MKRMHLAVAVGAASALATVVDSAMAGAHQRFKPGTAMEHQDANSANVGDGMTSGGAGGLASTKQQSFSMIKDLGAISPPAASWPSTRAMPTCPLDLAA